MSYEFWKLIHLSGMVLLVGNVTVTSIWKIYADRTRDARIIGFAQRLVTVTDWFFTFWGIVLLVVGWQVRKAAKETSTIEGQTLPPPTLPGGPATA